jgi:hypothetical protein
MPTVQFHGRQRLATGGTVMGIIGWQPVEPVGNRWNQSVTSEISAKAWKTMQNPCKGVQMCASPRITFFS